MERIFFIIGALSAALAVALGAFGAHGLTQILEKRHGPDRVAKLRDTWETAVRYQMYHALALLAVAWALTRWPGLASLTAGWCMISGVVVFSGTLYGICLTGARWLGAVTPIGGLMLMAGWLCLAWATWKG